MNKCAKVVEEHRNLFGKLNILSSCFSFLTFSQTDVSAKELEEFLRKTDLLDPKTPWQKQVATNKLPTAESARLDAGQVRSIILCLAELNFSRGFADKLTERLWKNRTRNSDKINFRALRSDIESVPFKKFFEHQVANRQRFVRLLEKLKELGVIDDSQIDDSQIRAGELTHGEAADILRNKIESKHGNPVAVLVMENCFKKALGNRVPLYGKRVTFEKAAEIIQRNVKFARSEVQGAVPGEVEIFNNLLMALGFKALQSESRLTRKQQAEKLTQLISESKKLGNLVPDIVDNYNLFGKRLADAWVSWELFSEQKTVEENITKIKNRIKLLADFLKGNGSLQKFRKVAEGLKLQDIETHIGKGSDFTEKRALEILTQLIADQEGPKVAQLVQLRHSYKAVGRQLDATIPFAEPVYGSDGTDVSKVVQKIGAEIALARKETKREVAQAEEKIAAHLRAGRYEQAIEICGEIVRWLNKVDAKAFCERLYAKVGLKLEQPTNCINYMKAIEANTNGALAFFTKAIELKVEKAAVYCGSGYAKQLLEFQEAQSDDDYKKADELDSCLTTAFLARCFVRSTQKENKGKQDLVSIAHGSAIATRPF